MKRAPDLLIHLNQMDDSQTSGNREANKEVWSSN